MSIGQFYFNKRITRKTKLYFRFLFGEPKSQGPFLEYPPQEACGYTATSLFPAPQNTMTGWKHHSGGPAPFPLEATSMFPQPVSPAGFGASRTLPQPASHPIIPVK